jgi:hypothetical protein
MCHKVKIRRYRLDTLSLSMRQIGKYRLVFHVHRLLLGAEQSVLRTELCSEWFNAQHM